MGHIVAFQPHQILAARPSALAMFSLGASIAWLGRFPGNIPQYLWIFDYLGSHPTQKK